MEYLNTFAYQTLALQQFAGALPNYADPDRTKEYNNKMVIGYTEESILANKY